MDNQNYKRTVKGSVGAGMGAIFNSSGRTYYILEHKNNSKYHRAGDAQKIIIDQIEMGRDSSCQVRFDESFETVSRKHCAIVRDGQNYQLIHLSQSNPTLVNGRPIQGQYYLQNGDEIQLSNGGPRMNFIVPQGQQSLVKSIRMTERLNLFREQALAPYRRALWAMAILLLLVILGFGIWTYLLNDDLKEAKANLVELQAQNDSLDAQIASLESIAEKTPEIEAQITELKNKKTQVVNRYNTIVREVKVKEPTYVTPVIDEPVTTTSTSTTTNPAVEAPVTASDARAYYGSIYRIIVDNITIEDREGRSYPSNISTSKINCGSAFITTNGTFVTARQNIQPWIYVDGNTPSSDWRRRLAAVYALGNDIIINYSAYSTDGTAQRLQFNSRDFDMPTGGDIVTAHIEITEEDVVYFETIGLTINRKELLKYGLDIQHATSSARAYATLPGTGRAGIPADAGASNSISGGQQLDIVYYDSNSVRNLEAAATYKTVNTEKTDNRYGTIILQNGPGATAFGAPVFMRESNGSLMVVGMYVGNNRVVPAHALY